MKKKLATRFPAPRIKKIMQSDEDIGKIALAVPVLVSKALEYFLEDLCRRAHHITVQKGLKTLNSSHLKECIHTFSVYDFLKDVVKNVQDFGSPSDSTASCNDRPMKRSKGAEDDANEDIKRVRWGPGSIGGRSRGRGRGRVRNSRDGGNRGLAHNNVNNDDVYVSPLNEAKDRSTGSKEFSGPCFRGFNLAGSNEADTVSLPGHTTTVISPCLFSMENTGVKDDKDASMQLPGMSGVAIDPVHFVLNHHEPEEEEDYDNEDG